MTAIVGFQCSDALLMCADSEQSIGTDSKSQIRKIDSFAIGGAGVAIGGAGDMDLIEYVKHQLEQGLRREIPTPENADAWMESFAKNIWKTVIRPCRGLPPEHIPGADFLIGLQLQGEPTLYKWERNLIHPLPRVSHTSIGSGRVQSEALLADLDSLYLPAHQMLLYAVRVMLRVKQLVQGCGGITEAVLLLNDGLIMRPATRQIGNIENLAESMDRTLLNRGVSLIAGAVHTDVQTDLDELTDTLKRFRASYEKIVPDLFSWYQKGEIRF
ncbi:MAG TPA: hypothetical protein VJT15_02580 [Pyrinomonadaceae bacterium]|nr:hypothetical protein [Pyrinomonadaceae bacterium]